MHIPAIACLPTIRTRSLAFVYPRTAHWLFNGDWPLPASAPPRRSPMQPHPAVNCMSCSAPYPFILCRSHQTCCRHLLPSTDRPLCHAFHAPLSAGLNEWPRHPSPRALCLSAPARGPRPSQNKRSSQCQDPLHPRLLRRPIPHRLSCPRTSLSPASIQARQVNVTHTHAHTTHACYRAGLAPHLNGWARQGHAAAALG